MSVSREITTNPRQSAFLTLLKIQKDGSFADQLIDRELTGGKLSGPDRGLFAELVYGVLRRQGTLDHILSCFLNQPLVRLEQPLLILLRLGLYQLLYLDRVPESAAVNETVRLAKLAQPRYGSLVNAVLRNYIRGKEKVKFPDPIRDLAGSIAARHSQPTWLVQQWFNQLGREEAELLAEASSCQPPLTLRANTLLTSRDDLLARFQENGLGATPCRYSPHGIHLDGRHYVPGLPGFSQGLFAVQDEASQMASLLLDPQPGERVLDACAAPGGKATHLAQLMENRGELQATDLAASKLPLIQESARRLSISIISTRCVDLLKAAALPKAIFDRILLDAPCSGLGVIRRHPEAKWRLTPADITRLAANQAKLLKNAFGMLKPGGTLLYSTCSTTLVENESVVYDFLSDRRDCVLENLDQLFPAYHDLFTDEGMFRGWPHKHGTDGFFAARFRKKQ